MSESTVYLADVRAHRQGWSKQELAHFNRVVHVLWEGGLCVETDSGATDEGEPWFVFCDADSGEVVTHFARISGNFVVCAPWLNGSLTERVLPDLIERFLEHCPGRRARMTVPPPAPKRLGFKTV